MIHPIFRIRDCRIVGPYTLELAFDDGIKRVVDFSPVLAGELFGPLRDLELFNQVRIDPEIQTIVWPNGADFDPATLHDWPQYAQAWIDRAAAWKPPPVDLNRLAPTSSTRAAN